MTFYSGSSAVRENVTFYLRGSSSHVIRIC